MALWRNQFLQVNPYTRPGTKLNAVKKLVIHWTANPGASAQNHFNYFNGTAIQQKRYASAHIFVDKKEAICIIPLNEVAYHANDGTYRGIDELKPNANLLSIGVEMCVEKDGTFHPDTIKRTEDVFVELCKMFNLDPIRDIVRHYDITHKNCPAPWVTNTQAFIDFKNRVNAKLKGDGWKQENGKWYFYKNGAKQVGWIQDKGKWYYLDSNGVMQTGWVKDKGKWYYLDKDGAMKTGWIKDKDKWYFLKENGEMATGWMQDKGKWYYLAENGEMKTGWLYDKGNWYYLKENGEMVADTTIPIKIGKDGKAIFG